MNNAPPWWPISAKESYEPPRRSEISKSTLEATGERILKVPTP